MLGTYTNPIAARTGLGRVARVYEDHGNPSRFGFVRYELPELIECPSPHETAQASTLPCCTLTNALQILQADKTIGFLCKPDNALADVVIQVLLESAFSASQPFQGAFCTFCASPLKRCLGARKLLPLFIDLTPRKHEACGSGCDAIYAQIDAQSVSAGRDRGFRFDADVCEELARTILADSSRSEFPALQAVDGNFITGLGKSNHSFRQRKRLRLIKYKFAFDGFNHCLCKYTPRKGEDRCYSVTQ